MADREIALIVGTGPGLSASLARLCAKEGMAVALAARDTDKLSDLAAATGAETYSCDVSSPEEVAGLFAALDSGLGAPDLVVFNPSARQRAPLVELDPEKVRQALLVSCFGGFLVGQEAAKRMVQRGSGSILFTGATASVKGVANSAPFAMGKFGLRGLCQSMARELAPKGIHVGHFIIDGGIGKDPEGNAKLDPDAIAETYFHIHRQHPSAWTWEVELRPWVESF